MIGLLLLTAPALQAQTSKTKDQTTIDSKDGKVETTQSKSEVEAPAPSKGKLPVGKKEPAEAPDQEVEKTPSPKGNKVPTGNLPAPGEEPQKTKMPVPTTDGKTAPRNPEENDHKSPGDENAHAGRGPSKVPPGHLPPAGMCRIWYAGTPPGHQPPPGNCQELSSKPLPAGAFIVHNHDGTNGKNGNHKGGKKQK